MPALPLPYFGPISWWIEFLNQPAPLIELHECFPKATFRNRCSITGANGKLMLTIPILGGREKRQLYQNTLIDYRNNWTQQHWQSIRSAYGSAPYFIHYSEMLKGLYDHHRAGLLFDFNLAALSLILSWLRIEKPYRFTSSLLTRPIPHQPITPLHYHQVFEDRCGFLPDLSVIDLIMNTGPKARKLLSAI